MNDLTMLGLFSGIGGFSLAGSWAGFCTVGFCEIDPFCTKVLNKHWPEVPVHADVRTLDGGAYRGVTLLTGGFPCQPFSVAGKRKGQEDDRHLWPEMARVIQEARPRWVVGENTPGILDLALDDCLADLESLGYEAWAVDVPACAVGAWHKRSRVWIVAHAGGSEGEQRRGADVFGRRRPSPEQAGVGGSGESLADAIGFGCGRVRDPAAGHDTNRDNAGRQEEARRTQQRRETPADTPRELLDGCGSAGARRRSESSNRRADVADADGEGPQGRNERRERPGEWLAWTGRRPVQDIWRVEPPVGRVDHGVPAKLDLLGGLDGKYDAAKAEPASHHALERFLREVWESQRVATPPQESNGNRCTDSLSGLPHEDAHRRRVLGNWLETDQELRHLWQNFYTAPQHKAQDMRSRLLERIREKERLQKMATKQRVNRLRSLGNAIVPQVAYVILSEIARYETREAA